MKQSNNSCSICGTISPSNDVHHLTYEGGLWKISVSDLRVLCRTCHDCVHAIERNDAEIAKMPYRDKWKAIFEKASDPFRIAAREARRIRRLAARQNEAAERASVIEFLALSKHEILNRFLVFRLGLIQSRIDIGLAKTRLHNAPGRDRKYTELTTAIMTGVRCELRNEYWLQCEIRRRRKLGLPMIGVIAMHDFGPYPELKSFSCDPFEPAERASIFPPPGPLLGGGRYVTHDTPPPHEPHPQRLIFNGARG